MLLLVPTKDSSDLDTSSACRVVCSTTAICRVQHVYVEPLAAVSCSDSPSLLTSCDLASWPTTTCVLTWLVHMWQSLKFSITLYVKLFAWVHLVCMGPSLSVVFDLSACSIFQQPAANH
jgi:hypothetical protein